MAELIATTTGTASDSIGHSVDRSTVNFVPGIALGMRCKLLGNEAAQTAAKDGELVPFDELGAPRSSKDASSVANAPH